MFRLIATDIDDTLLAHDGTLPPANHDALVRLHRAGVTIVFCSGRSDASIARVAGSILEPEDDEYYIAFNGARVVTARSRRIVSRAYVDRASIDAVVGYAREHSLHVQGYQGDGFVVMDEDDWTAAYAAATGTTYRVVDDLARELAEGTPKLLLIAAHDELVEHRRRLLERESIAYDAMFSKPHYLEIVARGVDKGSALSTLAGRLGIGIDETIAVGDGDNDVAMIRAAGLGLAVSSAHESARTAADLVLDAGAEDGAMAEIARRYFSL